MRYSYFKVGRLDFYVEVGRGAGRLYPCGGPYGGVLVEREQGSMTLRTTLGALVVSTKGCAI